MIEERKALADLRLAEALMDGGADARALDVFRRTAPVARRMGAGDRCALGMAQCFAATGKTKDALKAYGVFAREFADSPLAPQALLCAGVLCASPGNNNFKEARKYFDAVAQRHPAALEATAAEFYSATLAWRARKWDEAERLHRAFIEKHPDSPLARVAMEERLPAIAEKSLAVPSRALNIRKLSAMVSPNARIRHSCRIDQAVSCNAEFAIYPESGWRIVSSELRCGAHNGASALWTGPDPGTPHRHVYHLCDAFSSQELAMFDGEIAPEGDGGRPRTWPFRVTIPAVDIDWEGLGGSSDEDGEDLRYALLPLNGDGTSEARRILLRSPFDDDERDGRPGFPHGSKVSPTITLKWSPANSISLLRDGTTGITSGWSVNARDVSSWPISFDVVPMVTSGTFTVSCEGQSTGWGSALDRIKGRFAHVDLDVDANNDGVINGDDEATEMTKGGIVAVGSNGKIPINLSVGPTNLPGRITLSATSGGEQIRVWNQWRTATIKLPKTWNSAELVPDTLYIEGVSPSEHMRDVRLRLRYDENLPGESSAVAQCDDKIALTVIKAELEIFKPRVIDSSESMIPADEKLSKGSVTFVNLDNDDQDAYFDLGGATPDTNVAGGDDELVKLKLEITPSGIADGQAKLLLMSGGNTVAVWTNATKEASSAYAWGTKFNVPDDFSVEGHSLVKTLWVEGIAAHTVEREALLYFEFSTANIVSSDLAALTVIGIESVSWKGKGNSLSGTDSLDADPNWPSGLSPAALRVFPGARIENGSVGAARDKVDVEVSLSVEPPQPLSVYLRSFDVDDPTDDTAPIDNEANEEDNRGSTPKRAGKFTGESGGVFELRFNAGQKTATCEFQTTMQPGDNFRVVANGDRDFLLGLENKDSSQNTGGTTSDKNANKQRICDRHMSGNPSDKEIRFPLQYASPVLTVWRLLHIEVDSMAAPPSSGAEKNFVEGNLTRIHGDFTKAFRVWLDVNLKTGLTPQDKSANMTAGTGNGRFENGWIKIGSGTGNPGQTTTSGMDGNGDDFVERAAGIDIPAVVSKPGQVDITSKVVEWNGMRFTLYGLSANLTSAYDGGTLNVAGVSLPIATVGWPDAINVASAPAIPFVLHDDDDDTVLPTSIALDNLMESDLPTENRMAPLYIRPSHDGGGNLCNNQNDVPFVRNTECSDAYRWQSHNNNMRRFWVAYFLAAFQDSKSSNQTDFDPNSETGAWASANNEPLLSGVLFYQESQRDGNLSRQWKSRICLHELGHNFGLHDRYGSIENDGIMHGYTEGQPSMNYFWGKQDAAVIRSMPVPY